MYGRTYSLRIKNRRPCQSVHFFVLSPATRTMASEKLPRYVNHEGYLVAGGFPVDGFKSALKYEAQANDLFVVTYPKVCVKRIA